MLQPFKAFIQISFNKVIIGIKAVCPYQTRHACTKGGVSISIPCQKGIRHVWVHQVDFLVYPSSGCILSYEVENSSKPIKESLNVNVKIIKSGWRMNS